MRIAYLHLHLQAERIFLFPHLHIIFPTSGANNMDCAFLSLFMYGDEKESRDSLGCCIYAVYLNMLPDLSYNSLQSFL